MDCKLLLLMAVLMLAEPALLPRSYCQCIPAPHFLPRPHINAPWSMTPQHRKSIPRRATTHQEQRQ